MLIYFFYYTYLVGWREHTMTLMWRSGTSLQTLVLSFHYAGPRGTKLSHHRLTEPFPLSNLASLKDHLMYNFLLYFYLIGYYVFQKAKKKAIRYFLSCPLAHWTPLPRGSQNTSVLGVCQSSPCLSTLAVSLCPWTCAFVTQLCICTNFIHSTPCSVHHSFCVVPLGATYELYKVLLTSK